MQPLEGLEENNSTPELEDWYEDLEEFDNTEEYEPFDDQDDQ